MLIFGILIFFINPIKFNKVETSKLNQNYFELHIMANHPIYILLELLEEWSNKSDFQMVI